MRGLSQRRSRKTPYIQPIAPQGVSLLRLLEERSPETLQEIRKIRTGINDQTIYICHKFGIPVPDGKTYFDTALGQVRIALEDILPSPVRGGRNPQIAQSAPTTV